jgi:hypothetical protein
VIVAFSSYAVLVGDFFQGIDGCHCLFYILLDSSKDQGILLTVYIDECTGRYNME